MCLSFSFFLLLSIIRRKKPPEGWELIEEALDAFDTRLREGIALFFTKINFDLCMNNQRLKDRNWEKEQQKLFGLYSSKCW